MGLIFIFSAQPTLPSAEDEVLDFVIKKAGHVLEYAILSVLWLRALGAGPRSSKRKWVVALTVTGLYALTDEYHQSFVPGRTASLRDVGFDWLGAVLGAWVWRRWLWRVVTAWLDPELT